MALAGAGLDTGQPCCIAHQGHDQENRVRHMPRYLQDYRAAAINLIMIITIIIYFICHMYEQKLKKIHVLSNFYLKLVYFNLYYIIELKLVLICILYFQKMI